ASAQHRGVGNDEAQGSLAGHLPVDGCDRATAPEATAQLLHGHLEPQRVSWGDDPLEAALLDAGEQPDAVAEALLLRDVDRHRLGKRLDLEDAGHDRQPGKVTLEKPL